MNDETSTAETTAAGTGTRDMAHHLPAARRLARVFVELADTLVDEFDMLDFLQMLTERSVELLGVDASGLLLADQRGDMKLVGCAKHRATLQDLFELPAEHSPWLDSFTTGTAIANVPRSEAEKRWPVFTARALGAGFEATHVLPMRLRGQAVGALILFNRHGQPMSDDLLSIGQAMADVATIGLLHDRTLFDQQLLSQQLQAALHSRVLIEQAKGMLSARADITVSEAFARMRALARRNRLNLSAVAQSIVDGTSDSSLLDGS